jgi:hypothetical protein
LQKFKTTDGPIFSEPFHAIEPFLNWVKALEIFFLTKGIFHHTDKIAIVGSLIQETNTLAFYASKTDILGTITWLKFKDLIFGFALPLLWQTTLKLRLRKLHMSETELFLTYSTRGRTLMSLYNFKAPYPMSEWDLAKAVSLGLPAELKVLVDNFGELLKVPFDYNNFEQRVALFYKGLPKKTAQRLRQPPSASSSAAKTTNPPISMEETIWRIHVYLNSQHQGRIYGTGMPVPLHVFLLEPGANDPMCQFPMNLK